VERELRELNLVKSLAEELHWKALAQVLDMSPNVILNNYKETQAELEESSRRLFDKLHDRGYKGRFNWDAYLEGLRETEAVDGIVKRLEQMLACKPISRTLDDVKRDHFRSMTCDSDQTTLKLEKEVARHWPDIARQFGIQEEFISNKVNVPELCAADVLRRLYDNGYHGALGWQGVLDALQDASLTKIWTQLETALNCVVKQ